MLAWLTDPWTIIIVAVVALLLFGSRLPEVARSLGRSVNEFKKGLREVQDDVRSDTPDESAPPERRKLRPPPDEATDEPADTRTKEPVERKEPGESDKS